MPGKSVLVLGAQGLLGRFTARAFRAAGYQVLRAGRRPERAGDFRLVDLARPESVRAALAGVDLVVSSIEDHQMRVEREILRRGGVLLLQATVPAAARRAFAADIAADFPNGPAGTVVCNIGLSGVSSLVISVHNASNPSPVCADTGVTGPE